MNRNQLIKAIVEKSLEIGKHNTEDHSLEFVMLLEVLLKSGDEDLQAAYDDLVGMMARGEV